MVEQRGSRARPCKELPEKSKYYAVSALSIFCDHWGTKYCRITTGWTRQFGTIQSSVGLDTLYQMYTIQLRVFYMVYDNIDLFLACSIRKTKF